MKIDNVLILGSTLLTQLVVEKLNNHYNLVGYVPSSNPTKEGNIDLPVVGLDEKCDIRLSVQYDKIIKDTRNTYNLHTGLLPNYGGTNVLDYCIKNNEYEQGLTFHKMTDKLDYGPIISKITYPVLPKDTAFDLYKRGLLLGADFALASLKLLETLSNKDVNSCFSSEPILYKRGDFKVDDRIKEFVL